MSEAERLRRSYVLGKAFKLSTHKDAVGTRIDL